MKGDFRRVNSLEQLEHDDVVVCIIGISNVSYVLYKLMHLLLVFGRFVIDFP